jgi:hypothetical protein
VYASLEDGLTIPRLLSAAEDQFGYDMAAVDVFLASAKVALAFVTSQLALDAANSGLKIGDKVLPLIHRALGDHRVRKFTVSNTDCTDTFKTAEAIKTAFSPFGKIVTIAPRRWRDSIYYNGTWHVTIVATSDQPPPELINILGKPAYVDIPGVRRICRVCKSEKHTKLNCRIGKLAQQARDIAKKALLFEPSPDSSVVNATSASVAMDDVQETQAVDSAPPATSAPPAQSALQAVSVSLAPPPPPAASAPLAAAQVVPGTTPASGPAVVAESHSLVQIDVDPVQNGSMALRVM